MGVAENRFKSSGSAIGDNPRVAGLKLNPMIAELSPRAIDCLAQYSRIIKFADRDRIISRGDEMRYSGVVLSGGVRNSVTSSEGYELSMSILMRGSHYGSIGVIDITPSPWDCFAHGATELLGIFNNDFRAAMHQFPEIAIMLARLTSYRAQKAYAVMTNVSLENLENRLCRTLLMLAGQAIHEDEPNIREISITQETLGHFVQCTRPTVNKALKDLERAGVIKVGYGIIQIINIAMLKKRTEGEAIYLL